jgi:hypothetical protein
MTRRSTKVHWAQVRHSHTLGDHIGFRTKLRSRLGNSCLAPDCVKTFVLIGRNAMEEFGYFDDQRFYPDTGTIPGVVFVN